MSACYEKDLPSNKGREASRYHLFWSILRIDPLTPFSRRTAPDNGSFYRDGLLTALEKPASAAASGVRFTAGLPVRTCTNSGSLRLGLTATLPFTGSALFLGIILPQKRAKSSFFSWKFYRVFQYRRNRCRACLLYRSCLSAISPATGSLNVSPWLALTIKTTQRTMLPIQARAVITPTRLNQAAAPPVW